MSRELRCGRLAFIIILFLIVSSTVHSESREIFFQQMKNLEDEGKIVEAIKIGEDYLKKHQSDGKIYYKLARDYYRNDRKGDAKDLLYDFIERDASSPWLLYCAEIINWLAVDHIRSYHLDEAESLLRDAVKYNSKRHYIFRNLAKVLELQGKIEESKEYYVRSGELGSPYFLRDIKHIREKLGEKAEKNIEEPGQEEHKPAKEEKKPIDIPVIKPAANPAPFEWNNKVIKKFSKIGRAHV